MTTTIRPAFHAQLSKLQEKNHKRYSWTELGDAIGISRQAARSLFLSESTDDGFIKYGTLAALLDFFAAEGMPVEIGDLFTVTGGD